MRLNKFIATATGKSRREADQLIAAGRVRVNSQVAILGMQVDLPIDPANLTLTNHPDQTPPRDPGLAPNRQTVDDEAKRGGDGIERRMFGRGDLCQLASRDIIVTLDGQRLTLPAKHTLIMLHKPVGYVSSRRAQAKGSKTLYELLPPEFQRLKTVGRLDRDSSGLILLTDDGDLAFSMTHPKFAKTKIYEIELDRPLAPLHQQMISDFGIDLPDGKSQFFLERITNQPDQTPLRDLGLAPNRQTVDDEAKRGEDGIEKRMFGRDDWPQSNSPIASSTHWRATMSEGRNRQIRRTFAALGYTVTKLHRTNFGNYSLGNLPAGQWTIIDKPA